MTKKNLMTEETKTNFSIFERAFYICYFVVAFIAGIILYPMSFLVSKEQHNFDGYDL